MTASYIEEEEEDGRGDGRFKSVLHHFFAIEASWGMASPGEGDGRDDDEKREYHEARDEYEGSENITNAAMMKRMTLMKPIVQ